MFGKYIQENKTIILLLLIICLLIVMVMFMSMSGNQTVADETEIDALETKLNIYESEDYIRDNSKDFIQEFMKNPYEPDLFINFMSSNYANEYVNDIIEESGDRQTDLIIENDLIFDIGELSVQDENQMTYSIRFERENDATSGELFIAEVTWIKTDDKWEINHHKINSLNIDAEDETE